jgi:hypothetical protein
MRRGILRYGFLAVLGALACLARPCWATSIEAGASTNQSTTINIGQTITITVSALVSNPQDGNDGIFTFDQNFIVAPVPSGNPSPLQVISLSRPNVDDSLYGGSNGTVNSSGINNIYGGYDGLSEGIGSDVTLYTVELKAIAAGTAVVSTGPSTTPYGYDFVLNETVSPSVSYASGPTIEVTVPEPFAGAGMVGLVAYLLSRRNRRGGANSRES